MYKVEPQGIFLGLYRHLASSIYPAKTLLAVVANQLSYQSAINLMMHISFFRGEITIYPTLGWEPQSMWKKHPMPTRLRSRAAPEAPRVFVYHSPYNEGNL